MFTNSGLGAMHFKVRYTVVQCTYNTARNSLYCLVQGGGGGHSAIHNVPKPKLYARNKSVVTFGGWRGGGGGG
jgi:hypothetical protein